MAILKMKRLRLMLVRSQKEELLRELAKLGCVQVTEIQEELQEQENQGLVHRESSEPAGDPGSGAAAAGELRAGQDAAAQR